MTQEFELPEGEDNLQGTLTNGIELPFSVVYLYWRNGSPKEKEGVLMFGGWCIDKQDADAYLPIVPDTFESHSLRGENGDYEIYGTRQIYVAPIEKRKRWYQENGNWRSHMQLLAYVAVPYEGKLLQLGTHVLTVKGMRTKDLEDLLTEWKKVTEPIRKQISPNALPNYFYMSVGTFGATPNHEKTGYGSTVTPIGQYYPADLDKEKLMLRYVGKDIVAEMRERYTEAQTWLRDWDEKEAKAQPEQDDFVYTEDDYQTATADEVPF